MYPTVDVISIGHLSANRYWQEEEPQRPPLATTSLVRSGSDIVLVDPSLPLELMARRLHERSGLTPDRVETVFLTSLHPTHRRGLELFEEARWLVAEKERAAIIQHCNELLDKGGAGESLEAVEKELALAGRMEPAPDELVRGVHLFPSPGITPGLAGLLVAGQQTTLIVGDAVLTRDHFEHADPGAEAWDLEVARNSIGEMLEVADAIVPGHDNLFVCRPMM